MNNWSVSMKSLRLNRLRPVRLGAPPANAQEYSRFLPVLRDVEQRRRAEEGLLNQDMKLFRATV
jgi:hypothetical protein